MSGLSAIVHEADHCIDPTATAVQPCNLVPASMVPFNYQAFIEFLVYVNTARPYPGMLLFIIVAIFHDLQRESVKFNVYLLYKSRNSPLNTYQITLLVSAALFSLATIQKGTIV